MTNHSKVKLSFFLGAVFFACTKPDSPLPIPVVPSTDVYVSGFIGNSGVYWKNGVRTNLVDGTYSTNPTCIFVSGSDVHLAGFGYNGSHNFAIYWKNGVATDLTDGTRNAEARAIAVSGTDVYIAGNLDSANYNTGVYWKNGTLTHLSNASHTNSIAISGSDVYVAGAVLTGGTPAVYWKNGVATNLINGVDANAITVLGSDVYVAGATMSDSGKYVATYWKNGVSTSISDGTNYAFVTSMCISGPDVYVAATVNDGNVLGARYWKNGVVTTLANDGQATSIAVLDSDVYVAGLKNGVPVYWKNDVTVSIDGSTGLANGIFVK